MGARARSSVAAAAAVAIAIVVAVVLALDAGSPPSPNTVTQAFPADSSDTSGDLDDLAEAARCESVQEIDGLVLPIRGSAATAGLVCVLPDGNAVHLFQRAPLGDPSAAAYADQQGGSLENIDRLLETGTVRSNCPVSVIVSDRFFAVGDGSVLASLEDLLGEPVREILPASPTVSYLNPPCDLTPLTI